jgi:hypothetical protein
VRRRGRDRRGGAAEIDDACAHAVRESEAGACAVRERGPAGGAREGERRRAARSTDGERETGAVFLVFFVCN